MLLRIRVPRGSPYANWYWERHDTPKAFSWCLVLLCDLWKFAELTGGVLVLKKKIYIIIYICSVDDNAGKSDSPKTPKSHENVRKKIKTTAKFSHRSTEKTEKLYVKKKKKKKKKNMLIFYFVPPNALSVFRWLIRELCVRVHFFFNLVCGKRLF